MDIDDFLVNDNQVNGLTWEEVEKKLEANGRNTIVTKKNAGILLKLLENFKNPLTLLLILLAVISFATHDKQSFIVLSVMIFLTVFIKFSQEYRADRSAAELTRLVLTKATVLRQRELVEVDISEIVTGDIVFLNAGAMVPADMKLIKSKDLFVNQITLTGESLPVEKYVSDKDCIDIYDDPCVCFKGTNVESGTGIGEVFATGLQTQIGIISKNISQPKPVTAFERGIQSYTVMMIKLIIVLSSIVFIINGVFKGHWLGAFLFAAAVAVGLTPEMLTTIVATCLSKGALVMHRKKVIVKKINSVQNFGAMDILCTDKTGTLTNGKIILEKHMDPMGGDSFIAMNYAYITSYFQTGVPNVIDDAILDHKDRLENISLRYKKLDEVPFDFVRKRMSVIVYDIEQDERCLICKGAFEEVSSLCLTYEVNGINYPFDDNVKKLSHDIVSKYNSEGFRVIAVAYKVINDSKVYKAADETGMVLCGLLAFLDAPKDSAYDAIKLLKRYRVDVKVLTGDNELVAKKICSEVGIPSSTCLLGKDINNLNDMELRKSIEEVSIFAKLSPDHKRRIIKAFKENGHVVGFLGDGINDAPALRVADVGISVDSAADIAKETSDIILLENNLMTLKDGVIEGRKVFANITKYIRMAASSNFGNVFSVVGASLIVPFLPMLPIQILTNNMLYDISQVGITSDNVDEDWLEKPRKWEIKNLQKYIIRIGPISSIFDYLTFFVLIYFFGGFTNESVFQTGWFIESLITQAVIVHILRTDKIPFIESKASAILTTLTIATVAIGIYLIYSPIGAKFNFTPLPLSFFIPVTIFIISYTVLTYYIKQYFLKKSIR